MTTPDRTVRLERDEGRARLDATCDFPNGEGRSCGRPAVATILFVGARGYICDLHTDELPWWDGWTWEPRP